MRNVSVLAACLALAACGGGDGNGNNQGQVADGNGSAGTNGTGSKSEAGKASLLDTLSREPNHATLVKAVKAAGLEKTLSGADAYTLFAPTEAAFGKLPAGAVDGLLAPDQKGQLTALLIGHIVPGTVTSEDLARAVERGKGKAKLATMGGATLSIAKDGDALVVTDAKGGQARLVGSDGIASNGVVHGLDGVLARR
ncbi:MAG TPA: fasciclin domain-containing protein [Allosphingosinicella sp.]|jgi:uncharacterized surface protein with fasciclin (FAS1) repeats